MKEINISFIKHNSAKDIVVAYFRYNHPRMKMENLLKSKTEFQLKLDNGERVYPGTVSEVIQVVKRIDMWGFCDKITNGIKYPEVHYWVGKKAKRDKIKVMELFAHEIAHAVGYESENMAVKYGGIAAFSYMSMIDEIYKSGNK